jgi:D-glycero-alpha-D-manno-heptose-7-phosphate kinase
VIISRTPFRISFFGGGTDYPGWYRENGGQVLSTTIDKYCYISLRYLPPFFSHRIRLVYSNMENCQHFSEIKHPSARETLRFLGLDRNLEIHHDADLPSRSGMGSSSSFTVGLLHALYALRGVMPGPKRLAEESIHIEQDMIQETVGSQDQTAAAYGGFNHILFGRDGEIEVRPLTIGAQRLRSLSDHVMLFYTGIMRTASSVAHTYVEDLGAKANHLRRRSEMVGERVDLLRGDGAIRCFGELMHDAWQAKKSLGSKITSPAINDVYERARAAGCIGGKLLGAGGGGFFCFFAPPEVHRRVRESLRELLYVPVSFSRHGSQIVFFDPPREDFAGLEKERYENDCCVFQEMT